MPFRFPVGEELAFVLLIPDFEVRTADARRILPENVSRRVAVSSSARACRITAAFAAGNYEALRDGFEDGAFHQPHRLPLVPFLPKVLAAGQAAGALGGFLSGSGSTVACLTLLSRDEHMRPNTTMQSLGALKPAFATAGETLFDAVVTQRYPEVERVAHVHHGGNSSGIVDGAAAVLIGSREAGEAQGLKPRARIRGTASIGSEPSIMLTGPEKVTAKLLARLGMQVADIDLYELNEAFAAVVLRYMQALDIPHDKINVNGGAIAMGHPLGATGAMILGTALDELERSGKETALATLCIGGGMGTATVIERV